MRWLVAVGMLWISASGCTNSPFADGSLGQPTSVCHDNPSLVSGQDPELVWESIVDVVDDYFQIDREVPVRRMGDVLTEGRLDTFPLVGSTLLEPWHHDSANQQEKLESTLQSIRRQAIIRVMPNERGYWIDVAVYKELEDVVQPEFANAGEATFRYDDTLRRVVNPVGGPEVREGWIPLGRDPALEQRLIAQLQARLGNRICPPSGSRQLPASNDSRQFSPWPQGQ